MSVIKNSTARRPTADPAPIKSAADIPIERVDWLWRGRLAKRAISVLDGDPGLGKTTIICDLIARASRGEPLPGDAVGGAPVSSLIISYEDSPSVVIVPRLMAAKADLQRVAIWEQAHPLILPDGIPLLADAIERTSASLVVIDPLMACLSGELNAHRDQDIRRVLADVNTLADKFGTSFIFIRHLNKAAGGKALYRGGGSIGIVGAARTGLLLEADPDDADARVLAVTKCNLGRHAPALKLRLIAAPSPAPGVEVATVAWDGPAAHTADDLLAPEEERTAIDEASRFLRDVLAAGPMAANQVLSESKKAGISERTLRTAKSRLRILSDREGTKGPWSWRLPDAR